MSTRATSNTNLDDGYIERRLRKGRRREIGWLEMKDAHGRLEMENIMRHDSTTTDHRSCF